MTTPDAKTRRLDALAQDIAPARDLWPAIAAQIETPAARAPARSSRRFASWLPWAVTAGLAFVASGAWWVQRHGVARQDPELAALEAADPALANERRRLAAEIPALLEELPFEARFGATQSLDAVRGARTRIVAALKRDANDPELREWLLDIQQQEVRVMRAIANAGTQTRLL